MTAQEVWQTFCGEHPVIDIGCGWFWVFDFEYVRFDKARLVCGLETCASHYGDFHDMSNFEDGEFAFVNATQVIEHAEFPDVAISEWLRILKISGVIHLSWPGTPVLAKEKIRELKLAVEAGDTEKYIAAGGNINWVALDKDGKWFLDAHHHQITFNDVQKFLGDRAEILSASTCSLIARKKY